ncbi:hypothetical protein H6P81_001727 [Aristolochia fimbriata]|uniref:Dehydrogenase E1 component domain-containing protein n=1 Tax=Aristolochia fimbriata TaxID=158543 RepID=A0AAV7F983_ARIFI|nr:hypothetical protein H6P81_001727 [Aristolochia fimbriata]
MACTRSKCICFLVKNVVLLRNVGITALQVTNLQSGKLVRENSSLGSAIFDSSVACLRPVRFHSQTREERVAAFKPHSQILEFPEGTVTLTSDMKFMSESAIRAPCYRVFDESGQPITRSFEQPSKELALKMYNDMVTLQIMDTIFYEAQSRGRISKYMASTGEEAIAIASAAAVENDDVIFPQYRETGALIWRGFTLQEFANQLLGT